MSLIVSLWLLAGCTPTCKEVCVKLIACDDLGTERMSATECEESCNQQRDLYAGWSDTELRADFDAELTCLNTRECSEIADGACYDEAVFEF